MPRTAGVVQEIATATNLASEFSKYEKKHFLKNTHFQTKLVKVVE